MEEENQIFSCKLKDEIKEAFVQLIRTISKFNEKLQWVWKPNTIEIKSTTVNKSAFLEYLFKPTSFVEFVGPENEVTITINSKRLYSACTMIEKSQSVRIKHDGNKLYYDIKINDNTSMSRTIQIEENEDSINRQAVFDQHVVVKAPASEFCNAFATFQRDTDFLSILINETQVEFHTYNKGRVDDRRINSHVIASSELFEGIVFPSQFENDVAKITIEFKYYRQIMNLARTLSITPNLRVKDVNDEGYIDFNYFNFINIRYTMAGLIGEDDDYDDSINQTNTNINSNQNNTSNSTHSNTNNDERSSARRRKYLDEYDNSTLNTNNRFNNYQNDMDVENVSTMTTTSHA